MHFLPNPSNANATSLWSYWRGLYCVAGVLHSFGLLRGCSGALLEHFEAPSWLWAWVSSAKLARIAWKWCTSESCPSRRNTPGSHIAEEEFIIAYSHYSVSLFILWQTTTTELAHVLFAIFCTASFKHSLLFSFLKNHGLLCGCSISKPSVNSKFTRAKEALQT